MRVQAQSFFFKVKVQFEECNVGKSSIPKVLLPRQEQNGALVCQSGLRWVHSKFKIIFELDYHKFRCI